jgi:glycine cleavage system H protein
VEIEGCPFPEDARFDAENDVWIRPAPDGIRYRLGVTSALSAFAGRFVALRHRELGPSLRAGESVATLESLRFTGPVRVPVDGLDCRKNDAAAQRPRLLNDSPYEDGWVVEFLPAHTQELDRLPRGTEAKDALRARLALLKVRCEGPVPDVEVIELGSECAAVLARLDAELALREPGEIIRLVSDDPTSPLEMVRWQDRSGHTVLGAYSDGAIHRFLVRRERHPTPRRRSAETGRI